MSMTVVVTDIGRAAVAEGIVITQVGLSASTFEATAAMTALPGEFKRLDSVSGQQVSEDKIHVSMRDSSDDSFSVRSIAFYTNAGDLFALYSQPDLIIEKAPVISLFIAVDVSFSSIDVANISFGNTDFLLPPASTTTPGITKLNSATNSTAEDEAATPKAVNDVRQAAANAQQAAQNAASAADAAQQSADESIKGNAQLIWSGSQNVVIFNDISGGFPGDGLYLVTVEIANSILIHLKSGSEATAFADAYTSTDSEKNISVGVLKFTDALEKRLRFSIYSHGYGTEQKLIKEIYKVI